MSSDESKTTYPPMDLRPRDAARLAQQPHPPIAATHPDQWPSPYGNTLPRLHAEPNPYTPHRRA
jgi:hypothetical protein